MVAEIRFGVESIDHIAIPVRDLAINQAFYVDVLGLQFKTTRRNPDGTPRQTYVLAGNNIIGLHLPGVIAGAIFKRRSAHRYRRHARTTRANPAKSQSSQSSVSWPHRARR